MSLCTFTLALAIAWSVTCVGRLHHEKVVKVESQMIVEAHNKMRRAAKAVAMNKLTWNDDLAANAANRAKTCKTHGKDEKTTVGRFSSVGENVYSGANGRKPNYKAAIKAWELEGKYYDVNRNSCSASHSCHNYTQIVWATTESVGCAASKCGSASAKGHRYFIVCQYGPAGNTRDGLPYVKAASKSTICTQCPQGSVCITKEALCSRPENSTLVSGEIEESNGEEEAESDGDSAMTLAKADTDGDDDSYGDRFL